MFANRQHQLTVKTSKLTLGRCAKAQGAISVTFFRPRALRHSCILPRQPSRISVVSTQAQVRHRPECTPEQPSTGRYILCDEEKQRGRFRAEGPGQPLLDQTDEEHTGQRAHDGSS